MSGSTDEMIGDVRRALHDQADAITVADEPFDPTRSGLALDPAVDGQSRRPGRRNALVAIAAVVCLIVGVVAVIASHDRRSQVDSVGPPAGTTPWLAPTGPEKPMPAFPDGWQVLDYGAVRFAVPAGWPVVAPGGCPPVDGGVPGYVMVQAPGDPIPYCPAIIASIPMVTVAMGIRPADVPKETTPIGTFLGFGEFSDCGVMCSSGFRLDNGYIVSVSGPDTQEILDTFTDSGRVRALQSGPTVDRSDWKTVTYGRISFQVPPDWPTVDLPSSVTRTTDANGMTTDLSGHLDPGACRRALFETPTAYTGSSGITPHCPYSPTGVLDPSDGAWIYIQSDILKTSDDPNATTKVDPYLTVTVLNSEPTQPAVDFWIDYVSTPIEMKIGAGLDPAIARTIIQSLRHH